MSRRTTNEKLRERTLYAAASLFLEHGYTQTTTRGIAQKADINVSAINRAFGCKENILCELVTYVLEEQFRTAAAKLQGITDDPLLFYATETTMQLHMAESRESIRDLYLMAYSLPKSMGIIQQTITEKLVHLFGAYLPGLDAKDFYELEIASGGIMRNFLANPCDMYFTMERKVARFLETTFRVYRIPEQKTQEAIAFVRQLGIADIVHDIIDQMLLVLKQSSE